jgi:adenylate cyclase
MADFVEALRRNGVTVNQYLGDGFMAIVRGERHAPRAVAAGLDLVETVRAFNRPRDLLGVDGLAARVGVATGEVLLSNVGTYDKMDFTAIGVPVNTAARLQTEGRPMHPCISERTRDAVGGEFAFLPDSPRDADLKGLGRERVWDVAGRA